MYGSFTHSTSTSVDYSFISNYSERIHIDSIHGVIRFIDEQRVDWRQADTLYVR